MEHEDKAQNFLHENLSEFTMQHQNLFENLQNTSGFGAGEVGGIVGIGEEIASNLGGKFEEEEHDEEWKYINEVQQSEKQTMKKVGEEIVGISVSVGQLQEMAEVEETAEKVQSMLLDTDEMQEIHYSPTSIEDSSLATTTTTNNSSCENCEENLLPQREHESTAATSQLGFVDFISVAEEEDKENSDPAGNDPFGEIAVDTHMERPSDLDLADMHSNLNPEAKEFVPTFSNPTTPTSPKLNGVFLNFAGEGEQQPAPIAIETDKLQAVTDVDFNVGEPVHIDDPTAPHPTAVPRHLLSNVEAVDDFVAESPRKGRGADMDAISLPAENEFEVGADERPHELAEEIEIEFQEKIIDTLTTSEDKTDFKQPTTPVSLIDHGPETSVDLDLDVDMDRQNVMRKSFYIENQNEADQPIEDLLNTVQPIPTDSDSINNSFAEDFQHQQYCSPTHDEFLNKELLNVEEKEVISHSPSTEELQMQFQTNDFSSSNKDIPAIPVDLENAKDIQESIYLVNTSNENTNVETPLLAISATAELGLLASPTLPPQEHQVQLNESLLLDTSCPLINECNFAEHASTFTTEATASENLLFHGFTHEKVVTQLVTPSTHLTEEKHLMEVIKENTIGLNELKQQMAELLIQNDGKLPKVVEVEQTLTPIDKEAPIEHSTFNIESEVSVMTSEPMIDVFEPQLLPLEELSSVLAHQAEELTEEIDIHKNILNDQIPIESAETTNAVEYIPEPDVSIAELAVSIAEPEVPIAKPVSKSITEIVTVATIATTAVVAGAAAAVTGSKKPEPAKKSTTGKITSAATKSKVGTTDAKKTTETKKPSTVAATKSNNVSTAARPRTAPVKTATEKKTITATSTTKPPGTSSTTTTVRKHVTATSAVAAKPAAVGAKTTTATRTTTTTVSGAQKTTGATGGAIRNGVSTAAKTPAARPATATTIRKTTTTTSKPRPATAGAGAGAAAAPPTKPNTLGINAAANKPSRDLLSPRTTLTSQLRKTAVGPTHSVSNTSPAAKSPMKATTNGIAGKVTPTTNSSTTAAGNRKTITSTTTTKTFTARPAPKTATSTTTTTTTTTTARRSLAGTSSAVGTNTLGVPNASSPLLRKSLSPSKRSTTSSTASAKLSPNKASATTANAKNKTKEETKVTKRITAPTTKTTTFVGASGDHATTLTAEMLKEKQQHFNANIMEVMPPQANGSGAGDQIVVEHIGNGENGTHHDHGDNDNLIEQAEIALM